MSNDAKKAAYEKALCELCGVESAEDLIGFNIRYDRKVVDGMFDAGYDHAAAESVLQCVFCGERSFVISPINDSDGFCFAEQKIYSITWPTLADPDGNIAEVETSEGGDGATK